MHFQTINPSNNRVLGTYTYLDEGELLEKLRLSEAAFQGWRNTSFVERGARLLRLADRMAGGRAESAELITHEMGKPITQSKAEIDKCIQLCRYYAAVSEAQFKAQHIATTHRESYVSFEPKGAVYGIMPWNFPFWQVFRYVVPNLMAGNVALLKHAANVSGSALAIEALLIEVGYPEGVFQTLLIPHALSETVIAHPVVQGVTLTGSEEAGRRTASLAGKHLKKSVLELGGSDAFIVLKDAELARAAELAVHSRFNNTGQSCIAAKRFIVDASIAEAFTQEVKQRILALKEGDLLDETTQIGVIARDDLSNILEHQWLRALEHGAEAVIDFGRSGNRIKPCLLSVKRDNPILKEEVFGPIAMIIQGADERDLIELANQSPFGLGNALWTSDTDKAKCLTRKLNSGFVAINNMVRSDPRLPFGGVKQSGYGRELGTFALHEFVNIKTVVLH